MKILTKFLLISFSLLLTVVVGFLVWLHFTPKPLFALANLIPVEAKLTPPDGFKQILSQTSATKNISYSTQQSKSRLDIYRPKEAEGPLPVILFIHGGGFFKGDKAMAKYWGPTMAAHNYAFISIDYQLAPEATIFQQLQQINEALTFLMAQQTTYNLDSQRINLSGSSAGGFLALQLASAYQNQEYAQALKLKPVPHLSFKSLLLYSAVFDLSTFQSWDNDPFTDYLISKFGWGLTGEADWQQDPTLANLLNLNRHITNDLPPLFITDGNTKTFTSQAQHYANQAQEKQVTVETLFFSDQQQVGHGYQLHMDTAAAKTALQDSLDFLNKWN